LTAEEEKELSLLKRAVDEENPARRAAALRARKGRLIGALDQVKAIALILNLPKANEFKAHADALKACPRRGTSRIKRSIQNFAPTHRRHRLERSLGTCTRIAAVAYPGHLSQRHLVTHFAYCASQPLADDAKARFLQFEAFVKQAAANKLAGAQQQVTAD